VGFGHPLDASEADTGACLRRGVTGLQDTLSLPSGMPGSLFTRRTASGDTD
jgi:hypothetical protein